LVVAAEEVENLLEEEEVQTECLLELVAEAAKISTLFQPPPLLQTMLLVAMAILHCALLEFSLLPLQPPRRAVH